MKQVLFKVTTLTLIAFLSSLLLGIAACNHRGGEIPEGNLTLSAARPSVALADLKPILDYELASSTKDGLLSERVGGGMIIGVVEHGERRIFAYGTAKRDSIFEIGSITKTFTGLLLAQMVVQGKVALTEPIRELLPIGFAGEARGAQKSHYWTWLRSTLDCLVIQTISRQRIHQTHMQTMARSG